MPNRTSNTQTDSHPPAAPAGLKTSHEGFGHHIYASIVSTLLLAVLCCGIYPVIVLGIAQAPGLKWKADGSLLTDKQGSPVGSALLAQPFTSDKYFHERPTAAGNSDDSSQLPAYNPANSGGTNLGPTSAKLIDGIHGSKKPDGSPDPGSDFDGIRDLVKAYRDSEPGLQPGQPVPADAVTYSASGLDPHISGVNARIQAVRVARARGIDSKRIDEYIRKYTEGPDLGILGEAGVSVLRLNLALDADLPVK